MASVLLIERSPAAEETEDYETAFYQDEIDDEEVEEDEAWEILAAIATEGEPPRKARTWTEARKIANLKKIDRGFRDRAGGAGGAGGADRAARQRARIERLKKRTKCALCKKIGHWKRECPTANPASALVAEVSADVPQFFVHWTETAESFLSTTTPEVRKRHLVEAPDSATQPGYGVGDSGCGYTMVGEETLGKIMKYLKEKFGLSVGRRPSRRSFKFGNDGILESREEAVIPVGL